MTEHSHSAPSKRFDLRRNRLALAAAGLLVVGGAAGAVTVAATRPSVTMAPATPVAIRSLQSDGIVTIRGTVAEIYTLDHTLSLHDALPISASSSTNNTRMRVSLCR